MTNEQLQSLAETCAEDIRKEIKNPVELIFAGALVIETVIVIRKCPDFMFKHMPLLLRTIANSIDVITSQVKRERNNGN